MRFPFTQSREALELKHEKDMKNIDLNSIDLLQPRSIGGEHVALQALQMLGFDQLLKELGFNRHQYHGAIGSIISRMLSPGSELSTYNWLREQSGLGDLLDYDYESISLQRLYRFQKIFEESLKDLKKGLNKKYCVKNYEKVLIKIGRLKEKYSKAAKHYDVTVEKDRDSENAKDIRWTRKRSPNDPANHPGVYCIRSSHLDWEAKELWKTYIMLTDLESVFRSLKSELGFRPVYHQNADRTGSHLFITLLAFHFVQAIRTQLKAHGEAKSWNQLRKQLLQHERITVRMQTDDGKTIHMRKPNEATPEQKKIYALLGLSPFPGGRTKAVFKRRKHL